MITINDIELCFWKPNQDLPPGTARGILYVLRRDLVNLYGPERDAPSSHHLSPMLATIGMMTGIDLMSKLSTNSQGDRDTFKTFVRTYGECVNDDHAEAIYKLRCAQVHAYCLIDVDMKRKITYQFTLSDTASASEPAFLDMGSQRKDGMTTRTFQVNYWSLKAFFLKCVNTFEAAVRSGNQPLLTNFMEAMRAVGKIAVTGN